MNNNESWSCPYYHALADSKSSENIKLLVNFNHASEYVISKTKPNKQTRSKDLRGLKNIHTIFNIKQRMLAKTEYI